MKEFLREAAVVVAHPDDEALWFSSILQDVEKIITCFLDYPSMPTLGAGRRAVLAEFPLSTVSSLDITEAQSFDMSDWAKPEETPYGVEISRDAKAARRYRKNFDDLVSLLRERLAGSRNVFTHNPWGEYGHEDHVQVYRAIKALQLEMGFNLWFSGYCGIRSTTLMFQYLSRSDIGYITLPTNLELASILASLYQKYDCWTWPANYPWFERESFFSEDDSFVGERGRWEGKSGTIQHALPLNVLNVDFPNPRKGQNDKVSRMLRLPCRIVKRVTTGRIAAPSRTAQKS